MTSPVGQTKYDDVFFCSSPVHLISDTMTHIDDNKTCLTPHVIGKYHTLLKTELNGTQDLPVEDEQEVTGLSVTNQVRSTRHSLIYCMTSVTQHHSCLNNGNPFMTWRVHFKIVDYLHHDITSTDTRVKVTPTGKHLLLSDLSTSPLFIMSSSTSSFR